MKSLFNIALVIFTSIFLFSCRSLHDEIPQDIHEHEDLEKLVVTLTNKNNSADIQTINYIGGVADAPIHAHAGEVYLVELDFQVKHDNHYESVNPEIITEKDERIADKVISFVDNFIVQPRSFCSRYCCLSVVDDILILLHLCNND